MLIDIKNDQNNKLLLFYFEKNNNYKIQANIRIS